MSRYLYKKIQNISPESLNFQHSGLKLTTLGSDLQYEGLKGEKNKGLKATLKFAKEHDMCMTEAQIQGANNI